jgi:hypothetical protein
VTKFVAARASAWPLRLGAEGYGQPLWHEEVTTMAEEKKQKPAAAKQEKTQDKQSCGCGCLPKDKKK